MKNAILTVFAVFAATLLGARPADKISPFKSGEKLTYEVSYRAALVPNTVVAEVVMNVRSARLDGMPTYHVRANGSVMPFFRWFFDLNDTYEIWLDERTLLPVKFANDLKEGKYVFKSTYFYDWDSMKVTTVSRNAKWDADRTNKMDIQAESMDPLSVFFNLRAEHIESFRVGVNRPLQLVFASKIRNISFKYLGKEERTIKKLGKFRTLKFSCQLANDDGQSFADGSEFFLWITDDQNKIPLYLESPVKVGSIRATITKMDNLKFPLTSKIK